MNTVPFDSKNIVSIDDIAKRKRWPDNTWRDIVLREALMRSVENLYMQNGHTTAAPQLPVCDNRDRVMIPYPGFVYSGVHVPGRTAHLDLSQISPELWRINDEKETQLDRALNSVLGRPVDVTTIPFEAFENPLFVIRSHMSSPRSSSLYPSPTELEAYMGRLETASLAQSNALREQPTDCESDGQRRLTWKFERTTTGDNHDKLVDLAHPVVQGRSQGRKVERSDVEPSYRGPQPLSAKQTETGHFSTYHLLKVPGLASPTLDEILEMLSNGKIGRKVAPLLS